MLSKSCINLVGVILTLGGQYIRSHLFSTGEDFNSLIVAVFLIKQLKVYSLAEVWSPRLSSEKADRCRVHLYIHQI